MNVRVVDASALGALVFGEPAAERIAAQLSDGLLVAPALLPFELASICLRKIRAHPTQKTVIQEAFECAGQMAIESVEVDHSRTVALANDNDLTTYDASYLWLAQELRAELVTLDTRLVKAMKRGRTPHGRTPSATP
jgi:predicted nucleic acid-binding protein